MGIDYFISYATGNVVCIVILLIMIINDKLHNTMQEKQIWFNKTIIVHIFYFAFDIVWAGIISNQIQNIRILFVLVNFFNFVLLSLMAYEWFMYMAVSEKMTFWKSKKIKLLFATPIIISSLAIVIAYIINPTFWISETGELNSLYYPLQITVPVIYLMTALVISLHNAKKAEKKEDKFTYRLIGIYPIAVLVFGILQIIFVNTTIFCFGVTIMLLFFYIQNMQLRISVDSLTQLNNRGQINKYIEQIKYQENTKVYVIMIDLDHFKSINDTYGHAEGDKALILASEALKQVCDQAKTSIFLGRYGGDEFSIICQNSTKNNDPETIAKEIRWALYEKYKENQLPYKLEASIGYSELIDKNDTMENCMIRADEALYLDKRKREKIVDFNI